MVARTVHGKPVRRIVSWNIVWSNMVWHGCSYLVIGAAAGGVEHGPASLTPDLWVGSSAVGI